jgi:NADH-quinone oxidoreductase subunit F
MPYLTEHVIMRHVDVPDIADFQVYLKNGGYEPLRMALKEKTPADIIQMVREAGLRGRGGAGFPTGVKWGFLPKGVFPRYLLCNCDESEPATFNNHEIIDRNPHQLIEGIIISAYAIECNTAYIYMRGEFATAARTLDYAIQQAKAAGFLGKNILGTGFDLEIHVHRGAGAYICGEETALMDSLEGKKGQPRLKPPFPAVEGLYGKPTIINNVETLANVPHIVQRGVAWYRGFGTEKSPGTKVFSLCGHVKKPGNYEIPFGISMREFIYSEEFGGGGIVDDRPIKIVVPGGASAPWLTGDQIDVNLDYESLAAAGTMLGSGGMVVLNDSVTAPHVAYKMDEFFKHESCGKCTPCREGTTWLVRLMHRMIEHKEGRTGDSQVLQNIHQQMAGNCFCLLGESAVMPIKSALHLFEDEFLALEH